MLQIIVGMIIFLLKISSLIYGLKIPDIRVEDMSEKVLRAEYAHSVARMISENPSSDGEENVLIVKTDGKELNLDQIVEKPLQYIKGPDNRYTFVFQNGESARKALEILQNQQSIIYVETDQKISAEQFLTGDKVYKNLRSAGARQMGFELLRQYAGVKQENSTCVVAVIDSGSFPHPDYAERLILTGYDYVDLDNDATSDFFGHGTEVTGILADCTESLNVSFLPIRVLNATGNGKISNLINSIYEAVDNHSDILNLSLTTQIHSEALEEAVRYAIEHNCTVVFAAGNDGKDISGYCPCHLDLPGLIVVGSAEKSENGYTLASYSNYGALVDVYAFGTKIECCSNRGGYTLATGTSFAAPHISAACAILKLINGTGSPQKEEQWIKSFCRQEYQIPLLSDMIPQSLGVGADSVELSVGDTFNLKDNAEPATSNQKVSWASSDETVASVKSGNQLVCIKEGSCIVTGISADFCQEMFYLQVSEKDGVIKVPNGTVEIQSESFAGLPLIWEIIVPESVKEIGDGAFADCTSLETILYPGYISTQNGKIEGELQE